MVKIMVNRTMNSTIYIAFPVLFPGSENSAKKYVAIQRHIQEEMRMKNMFDFYRGKRVLLTGHTGFKGSWMCKVLTMAGADVAGYSLEPPTSPSLFDLCIEDKSIKNIIGDIRDLDHMGQVFSEERPEIVIHMAAQPIVRESYKDPVYTYETNVMGTVNLLECVRRTDSVTSLINVTTDKVYLNREWVWGYREDEELNGYDPYSNSKSCSELVTSSYVNSFFRDGGPAVTTCRAGNVIGGGDFAVDRIIPDCIRAAKEGRQIVVRNPYSTRPYQHVLEPVMAYLMIAQAQYEDKSLMGSYNIGPNEADCWTTGRLVERFCFGWKKTAGGDIGWMDKSDGGPHEASFLKLDCSKVKAVFGWEPRWDLETALGKTIEWYAAYLEGRDMSETMENQIREYILGGGT